MLLKLKYKNDNIEIKQKYFVIKLFWLQNYKLLLDYLNFKFTLKSLSIFVKNMGESKI